MTDGMDPGQGFTAAQLDFVSDGGSENPLRLEKPIKVTLAITETCNLNCALCYADCGAAGKRPELSTAQWLGIIEDLIADGIISIYIEGGEPLLRPDLVELLSASTDRVFAMLRTNGTLATPETAARLAAANLGIALVDIWGATAATHDALTGAEGSFELACAGVRNLLEAGIETQMLFILNRKNIAELDDYLRLAAELGVRTVGILRLYPLGRVKRQWRDYALSLDEMQQAVSGLRPPEGLRIMRSWHPNNGNCCWQMSAINAFGDSIGCAYLREYVNYGNVLEVPFQETWNHPLCKQLRAGRVRKDCPDCTKSQGSRGGCRSTAFAFHSDFDAPDPFDLTLNEGVDLRELPERLLDTKPRTEAPSGS